MPLATVGDGFDDGLTPLVGFTRDESHHRTDVPQCRVRTVPIGLVDHEHIGDFEDPGLDGLNAVTHAGSQQNQRGVRQPRNVHLGLPDADGLDQDHIETGGFQDP